MVDGTDDGVGAGLVHENVAGAGVGAVTALAYDAFIVIFGH